jgi:hypothetical protein
VTSIVIPSHNSREYILDAVGSCLAQTETDIEVIVVDDGSADDTVPLVRDLAVDDGRLSVIEALRTSGAAARNIGAREARGRFLTFLDSDDLIMPRYVSVVTEALAKRPEAGAAYCLAWVLDDPPRRIRRELDAVHFAPPTPLPEGAEAVMAELIEANFIGGVRTLRREAFDSVGGLEGRFRYVEDYDMWLRLASRGWGIVRIDEPLAILRDRPGSLHTDRQAMLATLAQMFAKVSLDDNVPAHLRERAQERRAELLDELERVERPGSDALWKARVAFFRLRRALRPWKHWLREPPAEVAAAFADLETSIPPRRVP